MQAMIRAQAESRAWVGCMHEAASKMQQGGASFRLVVLSFLGASISSLKTHLSAPANNCIKQGKTDLLG